MHIDDAVVLEIQQLRGVMTPTAPGVIPTFDDPRSFTLDIESGEVALSPESLSSLLNTYVFVGPHAPIKDLDVSIQSGEIKEKGKLRKGPDVPFSVLAQVSLADDGHIRLHPTDVHVLGVPARGVMRLFGIHLSGVMKPDPLTGVTVEGNDVLLDPNRMIPAPAIRGKLTSVRVEGNRLIQTYGDGGRSIRGPAPDPSAHSYLYFRGGTLRFGRLTMTDADLLLLNLNGRDRFEFSLPRYLQQLVHGYSKTTESGGLLTWLPDFDPQVLAAHRP